MSPLISPATTALALALVLLPLASSTPPRNAQHDQYALRNAECEYRGITATYEEISRAYIIETYASGHLVGWQVEPSPHNPDSESLVTAIYEVDLPAKGDRRWAIGQLRRAAPPQVGITWRYSTLAATRIEPANDYARDALETFTHTVNAFIARMAVAVEDIALAHAAGATPAPDLRVPKGTVLLVEAHSADWVEVRQPDTGLRGWMPAHSLQSVE